MEQRVVDASQIKTLLTHLAFYKLRFAFTEFCALDLRCRRIKTNMSSCADVHVRICGQEIIKYDLEIKALIQVRTGEQAMCLLLMLVSVFVRVRTTGSQVKLTLA